MLLSLATVSPYKAEFTSYTCFKMSLLVDKLFSFLSINKHCKTFSNRFVIFLQVGVGNKVRCSGAGGCYSFFFFGWIDD